MNGRTDEVGWIVVGFDGQADVVEEVDHLLRVAEISRLSVAEEEEPVEHVEDLRGGLVNGDDDRLVLLAGVVLQRRHQTVRCRRIQTRRRFLRPNFPTFNFVKSHNKVSCLPYFYSI